MKQIFVFILLGLLALPASAQDFDHELADALRAGDGASVERLVKENRLDVKTFVDSLISRALSSEINGARDASREATREAALVALEFEQVFGETSLAQAVERLDGWSPSERLTKYRADSLEARATSLRSSGDTREEALSLFREALALYEAIDDPQGIAQATGGIGYLHWYLDRSQYLDLNLIALRSRRAADDRQLIGNSLYDVGLAYQYVARDASKALRYYQLSDSVRVSIGDSLALNRMLPAVASLYRSTGNLTMARLYYQRAIGAHSWAGDNRRLAISERNQGVLLSEMGFHSEALEHLGRAQAIYEEAGDMANVAPVINWIGVAYRRLGDYDAAIEAYQRAIDISREVENQEWEADANNNLGVVLAYADRYDRATRFFRLALEQFQAIESARGTLDATLNIADSFFELEDYDQAEAFGNRALALADSLGDPIRQGRALGTLGSVFARTGRLSESDRAFDQLEAMAQSMGTPELQAGALLQRAKLEVERGASGVALIHYESAFDALEKTRIAQDTNEDRAGYLAQQRYAYEEFTHFLARQHEANPDGQFLDRAFEFAERGKARAFLDLLAEALADVQSGVDPSLLEHQTNLVGAIADLRGAAAADSDAAILDSLEAAYDQLKRDIRANNPRYGQLQYPTPSTLTEVQQGIDEGTLLLQYAVGDSSTTLIAVTSDQAAMYSLPGREVIQSQVELFRFALTNPAQADASRYAATANRLYKMLVEPARSMANGVSRIVVIPDGALHYVPFESLVTDLDETAQFGELPYLVNTHEVSYAPSASVLLQLNESARPPRHESRKELLAFGDPAFGGDSNLDRLPFSGEEVTRIAGMFGEEQVDVFTGQNATEVNLKTELSLTGYRYLHLATHGLVNEDRPDFSGIAFASGAGGEDGYLQAAEIFNLRIDADMVVLSACETGLGRMIRGEGLVGLTRAFMYAGAPSVVVSLWSVSDESTAGLMQLLYKGLATGTTQRALALSRAKREMIKSGTFAHPFHWAPFVLVGAGG